MRRLMFSILILLSLATVAEAQTQTGPTPVLAWEQGETALVNAQTATYKLYVDGSTTGVTLTGVACSGVASPYNCSAQLPAMTAGNKSLALTITRTINQQILESAKSVPLSITVLILTAPQNLRIANN